MTFISKIKWSSWMRWEFSGYRNYHFVRYGGFIHFT